MLKEFKEFAMRGSVVDMAVGIIIGGAFWHHREKPGGRRAEINAVRRSEEAAAGHFQGLPVLHFVDPTQGNRCPQCTSQLPAG